MKRSLLLAAIFFGFPLIAKPFYIEAKGNIQLYLDEIKSGGLKEEQHPFSIRISAGILNIGGIFMINGEVIDGNLKIIKGFGGKIGPLFGVMFLSTDSIVHPNNYIEKYRVGLEYEGLMLGVNILNEPQSIVTNDEVKNIFTVFGGLSFFTVKPFSFLLGAERIPIKNDYEIKPDTRLYAGLKLRL